MVKNLPANAGDANSIPGSGRSPEEGNGNPLQSSCPENSMDRGAWRATVCGVTKSQTQPSVHTYTPLHLQVSSAVRLKFLPDGPNWGPFLWSVLLQTTEPGSKVGQAPRAA